MGAKIVVRLSELGCVESELAVRLASGASFDPYLLFEGKFINYVILEELKKNHWKNQI